MRLDVLVYTQGLTKSRKQAQDAIRAGLVFVDGKPAQKPGQETAPEAVIELRGTVCPYVGRGGLKLAGAVEGFGLSLKDVIAMDIGASTGGFTDCMLQNGAKKVYAVDVGTGQLDGSLRSDPRVVSLERTDIRTMPPVADAITFAAADLSFISLALVLPAIARQLALDGGCVVLVKPQFEAGRAHIGKNGIVRDLAVHKQVIRRVMDDAEQCGLMVQGLLCSPITGGDGNREYLLYLKKGTVSRRAGIDLTQVVEKGGSI